MFFTNRGRVYQLNCYELPEAGRMARGTAIVNLLQLDPGEKVTVMLPLPMEKVEGHYLVMTTKKGVIKRTALDEFVNLRKAGLIALVLREDDDLISVDLTDGSYEMLLGTRNGMAIRFAETDIRAMGRNAMGVRAIDLSDDDEVVDVCPVFEDTKVLSITENGYGKRTDVEEYRLQNRGGKGIKAMNLTEKTGLLACQLLVHDSEDVILITDDGTVIRTPVADISVVGRNTQGVRLMRVGGESKVVCVAKTESEPEEEEIEAEGNSVEIMNENPESNEEI